MLETVRQRRILDTNTNIGDAIAEAVIRLEQSPIRQKVVILLTDGEHNFFQDLPDRDPPLKPRQAAQLAANLGIRIYAIDTGGDPPSDDPERAEQRRAGRAISQQIAEMTHGQFFTANDGQQLLQVYREIDRLERQPILSFVYRRYHEHYPTFLATLVGLVLFLIWLERVRWRM
jgi:Ca-activated chloride channel family protein